MQHRLFPEIDGAARFDMTPLDYVSRSIAHIVIQLSADLASDSTGGTSPSEPRCFHPIASTHEVPFAVLIDGIRQSESQAEEGTRPPLSMLPFDEFCAHMRSEPEFAPLLHELRPAGRPSVRRLGTHRLKEVLARLAEEKGCLVPDPEVTATVVARSIAFMARVEEEKHKKA